MSDVRAVRNAKARAKYALNREDGVARSRQWALNNPDKVNQRSVEWRSQRRPIEVVLYWNARNRAKAKGIEFALQVSDIVVPKLCPVLGLELVIGTGFAKPNSPSLDRIDPALGYIPGNIAVISHKANTIKSNATMDELKRVLSYMERRNG